MKIFLSCVLPGGHQRVDVAGDAMFDLQCQRAVTKAEIESQQLSLLDFTAVCVRDCGWVGVAAIEFPQLCR